MHVALDSLDDAWPDALDRHNILPWFVFEWTAKPLEKLLRYGLVSHKLKGPYRINEAGKRVLRELNKVKKVRPTGEFQNWKSWMGVLGRSLRYDACIGFKMVTVEVPGPAAPIPPYLLWTIIAIGAVLIIALIVLIVRTRRVT